MSVYLDRSAREKCNILLIAEKDRVRDPLRTVLENEGFSVVGVSLGDEANRRLGDRKYNLLIIDPATQDRDEIDVILHASRKQPRVPLIILYSKPKNGRFDLLPAEASIGAFEVVEKTIELSDLIDRIGKLTDSGRPSSDEEAELGAPSEA